VLRIAWSVKGRVLFVCHVSLLYRMLSIKQNTVWRLVVLQVHGGSAFHDIS
jgi:hypothetical protein